MVLEMPIAICLSNLEAKAQDTVKQIEQLYPSKLPYLPLPLAAMLFIFGLNLKTAKDL